jgi:LysM repeat protein
LLDFEKRLQAVDAAREADKKYIIETISQKVAGIVNTRAASPPSAPSRRTSEYGYEHVVKAGETLSEIAAAYKTTTDAIVKANGLKDANSIRAGQKLFIPE